MHIRHPGQRRPHRERSGGCLQQLACEVAPHKGARAFGSAGLHTRIPQPTLRPRFVIYRAIIYLSSKHM